MKGMTSKLKTVRGHLFKTALCLAVLASPAVHAKSKALIMGTGEFAHPKILPNLPGIDVDIKTMQQVAQKIGYLPGDIRTLEGTQLTYANVLEAFDWLRKDVGPGDHALIYFSGHGYQIKDSSGDESDGYDEILPLHHFDGKNNEYLVDDKFQQLIRSVKSARTHVYIDACCSGSTDRDIDLGPGLDGYNLVAKSVGCPSNASNKNSADASQDIFADEDFSSSKGAVYVGPTGESSTQTPVQPKPENRSNTNIMYLGAAQDDQSAVASSVGSYFTLAVGEAFAQHGRDISPAQLDNFARSYLEDNLPPYRVHRPNLLGPSNLQNQSAYYVVPGTVPVASSGPSQRERLQQAESKYDKLDVFSLQSGVKLPLGGSIGVDFTLEKAGYINLLVVDANDEASVLFPNYYSPEARRFEAGIHHLPEGFGIQAAAPLGKTDILVVYSTKPMNFYESSMRGKSVQDPRTNPFPVLSEMATRSLLRHKNSNTSSGERLKVGAIRFAVCDAAGNCK